MAIKIYKPTSNGRRNSSVNIREEVTSATPEKSLLKPLKKKGGRNFQGFITSRHRGGGNKQKYRVIDFKRNKDGQAATVLSIQYDPCRTANIALLEYEDGEKRYILSPLGLKVGQKVYSGSQGVEPRVGNCMPLSKIPLGLEVHNIEMVPGRGGKLVRTAGSVARLAAREGKMAHLILPSGEMRMVHTECRATIGQLGNTDHQGQRIGKAGRNRHKGIRPYVRGSAMNPVAHPMAAARAGAAAGVTPSARPASWPKAARPAGNARAPTK